MLHNELETSLGTTQIVRAYPTRDLESLLKNTHSWLPDCQPKVSNLKDLLLSLLGGGLLLLWSGLLFITNKLMTQNHGVS